MATKALNLGILAFFARCFNHIVAGLHHFGILVKSYTILLLLLPLLVKARDHPRQLPPKGLGPPEFPAPESSSAGYFD